MKNYKVQVQNHKAEFFVELLKNLDFVEFEEVEGFYEPRVYEGGNFEIRSNKGVSTSAPVVKKEKAADVTSEEAILSLRKALSQIEQQRSHHKK